MIGWFTCCSFLTRITREIKIHGFRLACCLVSRVLGSSGISRKSAALIVRYSHKKKRISIVFYCFENPSIAHNLGTTGPIQVGFSAKCTSPSEHFNHTKCHMFEFRLIPLDHITYNTKCSFLFCFVVFVLFFVCLFVFLRTWLSFFHNNGQIIPSGLIMNFTKSVEAYFF